MSVGISSFDLTASPNVKPVEYATHSVTAMTRRGCDATTTPTATATPTSSSGGPAHHGLSGMPCRTGGLLRRAKNLVEPMQPKGRERGEADQHAQRSSQHDHARGEAMVFGARKVEDRGRERGDHDAEAQPACSERQIGLAQRTQLQV